MIEELDPAEVGASVRASLKSANMNQSEAARRIKSTPDVLNRIVRGRKLPHLSTAWALADAMGVSIDEVVGRTKAAS